jgi:sensor histidine kinase YesM
MNSIQACILNKQYEEAINYLGKFSKLLRAVLENSHKNIVSLDIELQLLKNYIELEALRLGNNFEYKITEEEEIDRDAIFVPTLILQPFVENAILHGLKNKTGRKTLFISLHIKEDTLRITIQDNGIGRKKSAEINKSRINHQSQGTNIIGERINILQKQYANEKVRFFYTDLVQEDGMVAGTRVELILPIIDCI